MKQIEVNKLSYHFIQYSDNLQHCLYVLYIASRLISDNYRTYASLGLDGWDHWMINHSIEFVDPDRPWLHTETIEGTWKHVKAWCNHHGGTRDYMIDERLEEYRFHREYLADKDLAWWRMLRIIAEKGKEAQETVKNFQPNKGLECVYLEAIRMLDISDDEEDDGDGDDEKDDNE